MKKNIPPPKPTCVEQRNRWTDEQPKTAGEKAFFVKDDKIYNIWVKLLLFLYLSNEY
jgi:hypothetical protein